MKYKIQYNLFLLTFFTLFFHFVQAKKTTIQAEINRSNHFFKEKQYTNSVNILTNLLNQNIQNSSIYYNLGNSFYEMKEYPKAILFYEKANKLERNNELIKHNLNLANNKALNKIETSEQFFLIQWFQEFIYRYNLKTWSILCLIALWVSSISAFIYFRTKKKGYLLNTLIFLVFSIILFIFSYKNFDYQNHSTHAIVMQQANVFSKPSQSSKLKSILEAGNKISILDNDGAFYKVRTSNDKVIWILKSQVAEY